MIFRQLFDSTSGTYTYLLASRRGGEALIIDPVLEKVDRYLQLVRELDLKLVKAVDTHLHADHVTGLGALRDRTHCITVMGEQTKADVVSMRLAEGDSSRSRDSRSTCSTRPATPTISTASCGPDRVFTGDTLLIRGTGRTDFQNGDPRAQYESIFNKLLKLPDETLVYPAHDYKGDTVSTIGEEKPFNPRLQVKSIDEYVDLMNNLKLPNPKMMDVAVPANMQVGLHRTRSRKAAGRCRPREAIALVGRPDIALDRFAREKRAGKARRHPRLAARALPGLQENICAGGMLHELAAATGKRLVFYCAFGERSAMAVQAAQDAGLPPPATSRAASTPGRRPAARWGTNRVRTCSRAVQLAACPLSANSGHCISSGFVKFHQLLNWHRHDIGRSPCCRKAFVSEWRLRSNDRCDAAIAIEDGGPRSTVVDDEAVIPLIYFKEGGTGKFSRRLRITRTGHSPNAATGPVSH